MHKVTPEVMHEVPHEILRKVSRTFLRKAPHREAVLSILRKTGHCAAQTRPVSPLSFSALPAGQIHSLRGQTSAAPESLFLYPLTRNLKLNMEGRPTALFSGKLSSGSGYCNMECCCSCSCSLRNAKPHIGIDYRPHTPRLPDNQASRQSPSTVSLTNPR